ncbi:MAG: glutaredoxin domain-containing protein [Candidatus Micrarchaeota archaeon]
MESGDAELENIRVERREGAAKEANAPAVSVYSTPSCPYCVMAKEYLSSRGVRFSDYDVSRDRAKAVEMIRMTGQGGVPVIVIGNSAIVGFDRNAIDSALMSRRPS